MPADFCCVKMVVGKVMHLMAVLLRAIAAHLQS
jgi:hypothetical protein